MILSELLQLTFAEKIGAAIANMGDIDMAPVTNSNHDRRAHPFEVHVLRGAAVDCTVGFSNTANQQLANRATAANATVIPTVLHIGRNGRDSLLACNFAG